MNDMSGRVNDRKKKMKVDINFVILLYLYVPILIFLCGWLKVYLALPAVILMLLIMYRISGNDKKDRLELFTYKGLVVLFVCAAFLLLWCVLSGLGGYVRQSGDWGKHNVLLEDLLNYEWPVRYEFNGGGVMDYYIAGYLLPALVGKIFGGGIRTVEIALLLWTWTGLILISVGIYIFTDCKKSQKLILICMTLFLFSTFLVPMSGAYRILRPEDRGDGYMWLSSNIRIQYSSNIILLRWVFPQFVPPALGMTGLLINKDKVENWGAFCIPVILYSTFCFVGMVIFAVAFFVSELFRCRDKKEYFGRLFHWKNLSSLAVGTLLCIYILGNVLQPKPKDIAMQFKLLNYSGNGMVWFVFQLSWMIWCFILLKKERKNHLMYCAGVILFVLPFFTYGWYNDLVMRSSIPSLFVLCVLVAKNIVSSDNDRFYRNLLIGCLVINAVGSVNELAQAVRSSGEYNDNKYKYASNEEYLTGWEGWQYVNWNEEDSIIRWIMK